jgi:hypothetical protein
LAYNIFLSYYYLKKMVNGNLQIRVYELPLIIKLMKI